MSTTQLKSTVTSLPGGICWASMKRNGYCTEMTAEKVSKEECCAAGQGPGAAWSPTELEAEGFFFWNAFEGGVPCAGCRGASPNLPTKFSAS